VGTSWIPPTRMPTATAAAHGSNRRHRLVSPARKTPNAVSAIAFHRTGLRKTQQKLGSQNHRHRRKRERSLTLPFGQDQHISGGQQPWHVRDNGHHVDVMVVQQVETAERELAISSRLNAVHSGRNR
jgi:hypothetical protein